VLNGVGTVGVLSFFGYEKIRAYIASIIPDAEGFSGLFSADVFTP
jgi:hypothetical protein